MENEGKITFLHKVKSGAIDKSYGIHVARLAEMPDKLLERADAILKEYETGSKKKIEKEEKEDTREETYTCGGRIILCWC